ncbi:hypothetical protein OIO90_005591 [Microbotryomycetes sp. JL221]|nr:hypothetical protein OIO90_005591 [Microbotryomycetes sp. JL221]
MAASNRRAPPQPDASRHATQPRGSNGAILYASGVSAYRNGSYDTASVLLTDAIKADDQQAKYFDARCAALTKLGRTKDAFMDARQVVKLEPESYKGYHRAGSLFVQVGNWDRAEKMLEQSLLKLGPQDANKRKNIEAELESTRTNKAKASFCPFANLPSEIFVEIISLAIYEPVQHDMAMQDPKIRTRTNTFASVQRSSSAIRALAITSFARAPEFSLMDVFQFLAEGNVLTGLQDVVLSSGDGPSGSAVESRHCRLMLDQLVAYAPNLTSLTVCSGRRIMPQFQPTSIHATFPRLRSFRLIGALESVLRSSLPLLSDAVVQHDRALVETSDDDDTKHSDDAAAPACVELTLRGTCYLPTRQARKQDFPNLRILDVDVIGPCPVWDLMSAPDLEKFHMVVFGEHQVIETAPPDLTASLRVVQSLRLGGARRFAPRMLDIAVDLALPFKHLTWLSLEFIPLAQAHLDLFGSVNAPHLSKVILSNTMTMTTGLSVLNLPCMEALQELDVNGSLWVNDTTINSLIKHAPKIEQLVANNCLNITSRSLLELVKQRMPAANTANQTKEQACVYSMLTRLEVDGCPALEDKAVEWLRKNIQPGGFVFDYTKSWGKSTQTLDWVY